MEAKEMTAATFYEALAEKKLIGSRCACNQTVSVPPRSFCPECSECEMEWVELSGKGKLLTFTIVYIGLSSMIAAGFDRKKPYCVGIVELVEGPRISAMITGVDPFNPAAIRIGGDVTLDVQELGPEDAKKPVLAFRLN